MNRTFRSSKQLTNVEMPGLEGPERCCAASTHWRPCPLFYVELIAHITHTYVASYTAGIVFTVVIRVNRQMAPRIRRKC